jgi:hypothetical protein
MHSCTTKNITQAVMSRGRGEEGDQTFIEGYAGWENRLREVANIAAVIIAKQWMRPIGVEKLAFNPELTRCMDLCGSSPPQPLSRPCPVIMIHKDHPAYYTALPSPEDTKALNWPRLMVE